MKALQPLRVESTSSGNNILIERSCYVSEKVNTTCVPFSRLWSLRRCHSELRRVIKAGSQCRGFSSAFDKDCLALGLSVDVPGARSVLWYEAQDYLLLVERNNLRWNLDYAYDVGFFQRRSRLFNITHPKAISSKHLHMKRKLLQSWIFLPFFVFSNQSESELKMYLFLHWS